VDWANWQQPWFLREPDPNLRWGDWVKAAPATRRLVITQSLVPNGLPSNWRAQGSSGAYDKYIRALATNLVKAGLGNSTIRLGHEANGDWYFGNIGNTQQDFTYWRQYWNRFVRVTHNVPGANFTFDLSVAPGWRRIPFMSYYPGDDVVDVIGADQYDASPVPLNPAPTSADDRVAKLLAIPYGFNDVAAFAAAHGKPISIPEWGLMTAGSNNGTGVGDNPAYVDAIAAIVRTRTVAYQSVFNKKGGTSANMAMDDNPLSWAAYRRHFGATGDSLGTSLATKPARPRLPAKANRPRA
jgi:hypothetical protein